MPNPIKRHTSLHPISREHHQGLLLSWKLREGFKGEVAAERMKRYTDWFWENHLKAHFDFEEQHLFPVLDADNELIKRALREHRRLKGLFMATDNVERNLSSIEDELVVHIRFEERVLFQEIQALASEDTLKAIEEAHSKVIVGRWEDEFWIRKQ